MALNHPHAKVATAREIRELVHGVDEPVITAIQAIGASPSEIGEAVAWLGSDDYLHRKLQHTAQGRVAQVIDLLEDVLQFPEEK